MVDGTDRNSRLGVYLRGLAELDTLTARDLDDAAVRVFGAVKEAESEDCHAAMQLLAAYARRAIVAAGMAVAA